MKPHGHFFAKNKFSEASRLPYGRFFLFGVIRIVTCAGVKPHGRFLNKVIRINSQRRVASTSRMLTTARTIRGGSPLLGLYVG